MRRRGLLVTAALTVGSAASATATLERGAQVIHPEEWLGPDHYPPAALRAGEQGRVVVAVDIDADGRPSACRVSEPGSLPILESGTCQAVMSGGAFAPALDLRGRPVASTLRLPVRWVIPAPQPGAPPMPVPPPGPMDFSSVMSYAADNRLLSCELRMNGNVLPMPAGDCTAVFRADPVRLREQLRLTGPFRTAFAISTRYGDTPPPLPPSLPGAKELATVEVRQQVDADGKREQCRANISGAFADRLKSVVPPDPCIDDPHLRDFLGRMGDVRARQMLFVTRLLLLPPAN